MAVLYPRHVDNSDRISSAVNVVTWFMLAASGLAVLVRLIAKRSLSKQWGIDDGLALAALVRV